MGAVPNCGWGSHIIRQENPVLKFVLQDLIFMDSGTTEIMMVQGWGGRAIDVVLSAGTGKL